MLQSSEHGITDPRHWLRSVPQTFERISPLYAHIYRSMQHDPEIFALLTLIHPDQPIPVLFLSVVTFLVLGNPQDELAQFYPYLTSTPRPPTDAYSCFRAFCLAHLEELHALLPTVRLQTNEVMRCANLLPAFELVFQRGGDKPLALIEVGTSAGLNLNWPHYGYQYDNICVGDLNSPVQVHCELSCDHLPPLPETLPPIACCRGIEMFPLDLHQERDVRWLHSCIWPEEQERYRRLDAALAVAWQHPPHVLPGDACDLLPALLATIPLNQTLCLWHSFALNQGPAEVKEQVIQTLIDTSRERPIYQISLEANPLKQGKPRLELFTYQKGDLFHYEWLAECDFHGERMEWLAPHV